MLPIQLALGRGDTRSHRSRSNTATAGCLIHQTHQTQNIAFLREVPSIETIRQLKQATLRRLSQKANTYGLFGALVFKATIGTELILYYNSQYFVGNRKYEQAVTVTCVYTRRTQVRSEQWPTRHHRVECKRMLERFPFSKKKNSCQVGLVNFEKRNWRIPSS